MTRQDNGTAPPRRRATPRPGSPHQSQRHSAAQTRLSPPINHNGTAPPRPGSPHQSQRHGATQTRLSPPITTAQRRPGQALPTNHNGTTPHRPGPPHDHNHNGTAPHRPGPPHQSPAHVRGRARSRAVVCDTVPKIEVNTVLPPDPPDKNKNPSLRIREKDRPTNPNAVYIYEKSVTDSYLLSTLVNDKSQRLQAII